MKQQPPSAGVPEENKIRRITTLAACVQATNKVLILKKKKKKKKKHLCKEICRWQSVFTRAGGWKGKGGGGRGGGGKNLKGPNNLQNFIFFQSPERKKVAVWGLLDKTDPSEDEGEKMGDKQDREKKEEVKG